MMPNRSWYARVTESAATYSVTLVWLSGIVMAAAISHGNITFAFGALAFTLIAVLAVMVAMLREMRTVHLLVETQRVDLTVRIDQLTAALHAAGVPVPRQQNRRSTDPHDSEHYRQRRR